MIVTGKTGFSGEGRAILYDENMKILVDTGWSDNLITDNGLDLLHQGGAFNRFYIGSGATAPTVSDTEMQSYLPGGQSNTPGAGDNVESGVLGGPDYEYWKIRSRRFAAGIGTGTVAEIGMGKSTDNTGTDIFNRIVLGVPIVKGAQNILDVLFRLTVWPPVITTQAGTSVIAGITYDTVTLGSIYTSASFMDGGSAFSTIAATGVQRWSAFDGLIGTVEGAPAGDDGPMIGAINTAIYVPGDYFIDVTADADIGGFVTATDVIRCIKGSMVHFEFQTEYTEAAGEPNPGDPIPKDSTEIADLTWRIGWGRK
jgi:hypothetical protein